MWEITDAFHQFCIFNFLAPRQKPKSVIWFELSVYLSDSQVKGFNVTLLIATTDWLVLLLWNHHRALCLSVSNIRGFNITELIMTTDWLMLLLLVNVLAMKSSQGPSCSHRRTCSLIVLVPCKSSPPFCLEKTAPWKLLCHHLRFWRYVFYWIII